MTSFSITKYIEIDAAHRVPDTKSMCRNIHGHRYKIEATVLGPLSQEGPEKGMVTDFSFLKEGMMSIIHGYCDHAMILQITDPFVKVWCDPDRIIHYQSYLPEEIFSTYGTYLGDGLNLYLIGKTPTAENLAEHWFHRLGPDVMSVSKNRVWLERIIVHETASCSATYEGEKKE